MKALTILAPLVAALAGCSYYSTPPVAVAPAYVTPAPNTVVLGAPAATTAPSVIVQPSR